MNIRRIIFLLLFCLYIGAVAYLCLARPDNIPNLPQSWFGLPADKVAHFLMFLPYTLLGYLAFEGTGASTRAIVLLLLAFIGCALATAVITEHIQAHLGYRSKDNFDLLADCMGVISGGVLTSLYILIKNRK